MFLPGSKIMISHFKVLVALGIAALPLGGCQTAAQQELARLTALDREAGATYTACVNRVAENPSYGGILSRLPLPGSANQTPTMPQMTDQSRATREDVQTLVTWHAAWAPCSQARIEAFRSIDAGLAAALLTSRTEADDILVALANGQRTFGEASRELASLNARHRARAQDAYAVVNRRLEGQHAGEVQQRQAAAMMMAGAAQQYSLQQQMIAAQNRPQTVNVRVAPSTTNCYTAGGQLVCNTQ
jgi:hypothetical protein